MKPETRAFLDLVRDAESATTADEARVECALRAALERGVVASVDVGRMSGWLGQTSRGLAGLGSKLSVIAACTLALGTSDAPRTSPLPTAAAAQVTSLAEVATRPGASPPVHEAAPAPARDASAAHPPPHGAATSNPPRRPASSKELPSAASLRAELELLQRVQSALRRGDGQAALAELAGHRSADCTLRAERDAARVLALCLVGKNVAAERAAARFFAEHPGSLQGEALAASCANPSRKGAP